MHSDLNSCMETGITCMTKMVLVMFQKQKYIFLEYVALNAEF
jgi:hypothetical protein